MDLDAVLEALHQNLSVSSNTSTTATLLGGLLPTTLLENLVPGYGYIHKIVLQTVGFDITLLVSLWAALWLVNKAFNAFHSWGWAFVRSYWMSDISISSIDEIHDEVIEFLAYKYQMKSSRSLQAATARRGYWDLDNEDSVTLTQLDGTGIIQWLNFADQDSKTKPQFTPSMEPVILFGIMVDISGLYDRKKWSFNPPRMVTRTIPIKEFLQEAKDYSNRNHSAKTVIRRPANKERRAWGGRSSWTEVARRPCRPMRTVVLDEVMKSKVLRDINEYLNPSTARTGKTSLTFALAGVFGLNIYVVSLLEPTLTEEELGNLFTNLPPRCIVLLEDIDTAGLTRVNEDKVESSDESSSESSSSEDEDELVTKKSRRKGKSKSKSRRNKGKRSKKGKKSKKDDDEKKGISLSGLLNIIDGVASHEGRVLVMTTNHPEKLDEALIRPGRVDCQVAFTNATRHQIKEIFERICPNQESEKTYANLISDSLSGNRPLTPPDTPIAAGTETCAGTGTEIEATTPTGKKTLTIADIEKNGEEQILEEGELKTLANQFSEYIEDYMFSPAEIQGFLLTRKKAPRKAVEEIGAWVQATRKSKVEGQKFT
ncbi:mitochondrial chaperone protein [Botrytis cinerea]